jgi:glutathione transport system permease protein
LRWDAADANFSVELGWLPTVGADSWQHYILPSITLGAAVAR